MNGDRLGSNYLKLWAASSISNLGDGVRWVALPLFAITLTRDPAKIAAIDVAASLPWFLFSLPAGALVDRLDRRLVMVVANVFRAAVMAVLAGLVLTDTATLPVLYGLAFCLGMAEVMFDNSAQAIMPRLVDHRLLEKANGRLSSAELTANQFVGPPVGGFLFAAMAALPFMVDAASFAVSALLIFLIAGRFKNPRDETLPPTRFRHEIAEGLKWLWGHRLLRRLAMYVGVQNMMSNACFAIFVLFAVQILDLTEAQYGLLLTSLAVGSLIAGLTADRVAERLGRGTTIFAGLLLGGVSYLLMGSSSNPFVVGAGAALLGFPVTSWNVITVSLRQRLIPDRLLGRVNSVYRLLAWGTIPLGAFLGGLLARVYGLRAPFFVAAAVQVLLAFLALSFFSNTILDKARAESSGESG